MGKFKVFIEEELARTVYLDCDNRKVSSVRPCIKCGRQLKNKDKYWVHLSNGGPFIVNQDDEKAGKKIIDDMGWFEIGPECVKHLPKEYYIKD